jgi:LuxR family maltose regulon positive regulatory protein
METSLLATKLFIPPARPGIVPRPRLMERLQAVLTCRLTLVSASAGFGKSTVLTQWISENKLPGGTAWVSLDEGDNDPIRFWDYFIAALRTLHPTIGETALALLRSPQSYSAESVLTALINDVTDISYDFVIVLDDYQLIKAEPIHSAVVFLLEHMPPTMHLVIATRADPPLHLSRLRGRGTMAEIGADDLRFNVEETAALLKAQIGRAHV